MKNACAGPFGSVYDFWIEREGLARIVAPALWGIDLRPMFASMRSELAAVADGATILDVPCGGGVAFRALDPLRSVRYHAVDLEPAMLDRARARAAKSGLRRIEFLAADMRDLPFADGGVDLGLSYSGLHMIPDPDRAIAELARCVKPGGRIAGSTFLGNGPWRQRALFELGGRTGHAVPKGTDGDLAHALLAAGLTDVEVGAHRGFAVFAAQRP